MNLSRSNDLDCLQFMCEALSQEQEFSAAEINLKISPDFRDAFILFSLGVSH